MYRSKFCRVSVPVVGALGGFVLVCALGATAEAFDTPTVKPPAAAQSAQVEQLLKPEVGPVVAPQAVLRPAEPTRSTMAGGCGNEFPGDCDDNQNGLRSFSPQEFPNAGDCWDHDGDGMCDTDTEDIDEDGDCDIADCHWLGTAYPIVVEGTSVDTITFQVNTNFAGGDIYLTGGDASCNPNVFDMRRMLGCVISGLEPLVPHDVHFDSFATTPGETIWAIFVARTGNAGADALGFYNGSSRRSHSVAATNLIPSELGNTFHNQATTGNIGDWTDSHTLTDDGLGFHACVSLSQTGQDPGTYDCVANPEPMGACCGVEGGDPCGTCPTDVDGSGDTGAFDLAFLLGNWGSIPGGADPAVLCLDADGDGDIGAFDLAFLLGNWGECPLGAGGDACAMMRGFACGDAGGVYLGDGSTCGDCNPACNDKAGDCCVANFTPGCDASDCCHYVCLQLDPLCCTDEEGGWDTICAGAAQDQEVGCGQIGEVCQPSECDVDLGEESFTCIQSDDNYTVNGALGFVIDEYGAWASVTWSGGNEECDFGDKFKPVGFAAAEGVFGNALFLYIDRGDPDLNQRAVLSGVPNHETTYPVEPGDAALFPEIPLTGVGVASDTTGDGLNDTLVSQFILCHLLTDVRLTFDVVQNVELVASGPGESVSVLTQVYTIENTSATALEFTWIRQVDSDLFWIGDHTNDVVGTMTHTDGGDVSVYTEELNRPTTAVTLSSPQGAFYYGGKGGIDPDGSGTCDGGFCTGGPHDGEACDPLDSICGGGPAYGCGTDFQQWDAYGIPEGWANHVAGVGYDVDGSSGSAPEGCDPNAGGCQCDGSIGVGVVVSLDPGQSTCVCIQYTYGQRTPWLGGTCPEGCN